MFLIESQKNLSSIFIINERRRKERKKSILVNKLIKIYTAAITKLRSQV